MLESDSHRLEVVAPSRLHFGLLAFGTGAAGGCRVASVERSAGEASRLNSEAWNPPRQFGGAGVMIEQPGLRLRLSASERLLASGPGGERALEFARRFVAYHRLAAEPSCRIDVAALPRQHVGLGVGTSLGMAVAAGLAAWLGLPAMPAEQLAASVGRGRRSAVGAHGFLHGGLIVEEGKSADDGLSALVDRVELPAAWRFVLVIPRGSGLWGAEEDEVFARLPPAPESSAALREELTNRLLPAARRGDFDEFSESLYCFNRAAGECYAAHQGGPYASDRLAELVAALRTHGVRGVGQSSWGPTVFALLADAASAEALVHDFRRRPLTEGAEWITTQASRQGARIERRPTSAGL